MSEIVHAYPTKDFFVRMVTRDITLEDCILDLLDNCLDGAGKDLQRKGQRDLEARRYEDYFAEINISPDAFSIIDNCGGIAVDEAINHAFHFGRIKDAPMDADFSIGLYGIGMKRAIFKIGDNINIESSTDDEAFSVIIDVNQWEKEESWDFELTRLDASQKKGTSIKITELNSSVSDEFSDSIFLNQLIKIIARDYSFFLQKGFRVNVNEQEVSPYRFSLKESTELEPVRFSYEGAGGVIVEISAGLSGLPPDDSSAEAIQPNELEYFGWFVACNDRIVLAGDKSKDTGWGHDGFPIWHPQYNGFMGIVNFKSPKAGLLPWTTTKREIELDDPLYRQALVHMKKVTRKYIDYSNARKQDLERAKALELEAISKSVSELPPRENIKLPGFAERPRIVMANVCYTIELERLRKVAAALGYRNMSYRGVGEKTFKYFYDNEVERSRNMPSTDSVNYSIRPNKNIERKLIVQFIDALNPLFEIPEYRYIGMGSFWFLDFVLFHKVLSVENMVSIEHYEYSDRAEYNRPFKCIEVEAGDTTKILPDIGLENNRTITWLDYDSHLGNGPVLDDLRIVCNRAKSGSIVMVTINAHSGQVSNQQDEHGNKLSRHDATEAVAAGLLPAGLKASNFSFIEFPRTLAKILFTHCDHETRMSGSGAKFIPIFNFFYKDGAPMITIGGMIANAGDEQALIECDLPNRFNYITGEKQFDIKVPPLTAKEKAALDRLLPAAPTLTSEYLLKVEGFTLSDDLLAAYQEYYRIYPVYGEIG